jgi:hypothetical protein
MSIQIPNPQTKKLVQPNTSDALGSIYVSQNLDIQENIGRVRVGKRLVVVNNDTDLTGLYNPVAFVLGSGAYRTLGGTTSSNGVTYKNDASAVNATFSADATSNAPSTIDSRYSDMAIGVNGLTYATGLALLHECSAGGGWSATTRNLDSGSPHMLCPFYKTLRMYVTTGDQDVRSVSTAIGGTMGTLSAVGADYSISLSDNLRITFIKAGTSAIWIGTVDSSGGKGYVYTWDGVSAGVTGEYLLDSAGAVSCVIKDEIPHIIDVNGDLKAFNGSTFVKLAGFNKKGNGYKFTDATAISNTRFIHPNGMTLINGRINILINTVMNDYAGNIIDTIPSGLWEYTPENGLVHKHSLSLTKSADTIIDYGQNRVARVGAINEIIPNSTIGVTENGNVLIGGAVYTDATTVRAVISYNDLNDTLEKAGTWVTPKIESQNITDTWQAIYPKYRKFLTANDKIVVKYRTEENEPVEVTGIWTSTTTFTTTTSLTAFAVGDEIEVTQGLGSGKCAHITTLVNNAGTWTVTVDETFTGATGTSKIRFDTWIKVGTVNDQTTNYKKFIPTTGKNDTWIQIKLWMLFTGKGEVQSISIVNDTHKPTT